MAGALKTLRGPVDTHGVRRCPVEGCDRRVPFGFKNLAVRAASLRTYLPMIGHLVELQPELGEDESVGELFESGVRFEAHAHRAAHGDVHMFSQGVTPVVLQSWKDDAERVRDEVGRLDPEWSDDYWSKVVSLGLEPAAIRYRSLPPAFLRS